MATAQKAQGHKPRSVHLDLDDLLPEERSFTLGGKVYLLPGEIDIDAIIEGVRLSSQLRGGANLDEDESVRSLERLREIVEQQMRAADPDVEMPRFTFTALDYIFGLMMGEIDTRAQEAAIQAVVIDGGGDADEEGKVTQLPPTRRKTQTGTRRKRATGQRRKR